MNLKSKKKLAAKVLGVGVRRIVINRDMAEEIKEAITRQDIRDLKKEGIITIKAIKGRRTNIKRKTKKGPGSVRKKINRRKQDYVKKTRKMRNYVKNLNKKAEIEKEEYKELRKRIKSRTYKDLAHLKEAVKKEK